MISEQEQELDKARERDKHFAAHKTKIITALRRGYERGNILAGGKRPATFDADEAWNAVQNVAGDIRRLKGMKSVRQPGRKGRPSGRTAEDPVALLAPIYKRYTGAKATASHPHTKKKNKLIPFYNGTDSKKPVNKRSWSGGPFVGFVIAVAEACDLWIGASSIDKVMDLLRESYDRDDGRAEAQARFQSTHLTAKERYRSYLESIKAAD
jgi:hypothetical protein